MPRAKQPRFATAHDVARAAGVSQSAVSRAFTPGASVSPQAREKILSAARQLGYRPNILARSLIQRRSHIVGVVSGYMEHPFFARALERLTTQLAEHGLRILLFTAEANTSVDKMVDEMLSYQVAAVILTGVSVSSTLADECSRAGIPVILFSRTAAAPGTMIEIMGDNDTGARAIAELFVDAGRKRIAFMAGYAESPTSLVRETAFMDFFAERGLPPPRRVVGNYRYEDATHAAHELFAERAKRPDAIFCANDIMAIATIDAMRSDYGLVPGEECAVAGFDNIPMAAWRSIELTTYSQPMDEMADEAARIIVDGQDTGGVRSFVKQGALFIRKTA